MKYTLEPVGAHLSMEFRSIHMLHTKSRGFVLGKPNTMLHCRLAPSHPAATSCSYWSDSRRWVSLDLASGSRFEVASATIVSAEKKITEKSPQSRSLTQCSHKCGRVSEPRRGGVSAAAGTAEIEETEREEQEGKRSSGRSGRGSAFKCILQMSTAYNEIVILEAPEDTTSMYAGSRVLLLDSTGNLSSIYRSDSAWTDFYWDECASLPPVLPDGPVAIFGLAGGTAARLLLEVWPYLRVEGYEIDEILVDQARLHLGLSDLEIPNSEGGRLAVHIGDAFSPTATVDGGFAGIIVDLFSAGGVVEELQKVETWLNMEKKLRRGGRIMVNCGGICVEKGDPKTNLDDGTWTWEDGGASKDATLSAMAAAFEGKLSWRKMDSDAENFLALTGPLPNLESWAAAVPERLKEGVTHWRPYN